MLLPSAPCLLSIFLAYCGREDESAESERIIPGNLPELPSISSPDVFRSIQVQNR